MIRIILYDRDGTPSGTDAIIRIHCLSSDTQYRIVRETHYSGLMMRDVMDRAWIEFETEEEAALFKLTHL